MDDVLECLVIGWVTYLNNRYGTSAKPEDVDNWDITKAFPTLTREQVYGAANEDEMWDLVGPMPGADEAMRKMIADGHDVYVVTASGYQTLRAKMENVLFKYFPYITWDHVIITEKKNMIKGDILIDDGPHNMTGDHPYKLLFSAGHNRYIDAASIGAKRVANWEEAYAEVQRIAAGQVY